MTILALDLGKSKTVACTLDKLDGTGRFTTVATTPTALTALFEAEQPDRVVFEIGPQAGWVHDLVAAHGLDAQVANPNHEAWRWRHVKRKTDRLDALKLARLSAMNQLPTVYMPSPRVRQWRNLIAYRKALVEQASAIKTRIRSVLTRQGLSHPAGKAGWTLKALAELTALARPLADVSADEVWRGVLATELELLSSLQAAVASVEARLDALGGSDPRVRLLRTVRGFGPRVSEALAAAIDDPHRFRHGRQVGSYFGLAPAQWQSGGSDRHGRITGQGNRLVRSLLVEVAWLGLRHNPWMRAIYQRVRRGSPSRSKIAIVAVARRLAVLAWAMLRDQSRWRPPAAACAAA